MSSRTRFPLLLLGLLLVLPAPASLLQAQVWPLSENTWTNPEFVKRFLGSYGVRTAVEPQISREEADFFNTLVPLIGENPDDAIRRLRGRITEETSPALDYTLANILLQQGRNADAAREYRNAIRKFPNFLRAYKNLGLALIQAADYTEAIPMLVKAIELGDGDGDTFGLLAFCYLNTGQYHAAIDAYRNARMLNPRNRDWRIGLAQALIQISDHVQAAALLKDLIRENPDAPQYWISRVNAFISMNQPERAVSHLEVLRRLGRADAPSLLLLGDIYTNQNLNHLAVAAYQEALGIERPATAAQAIRIAGTLTARGQFDDAVDFISRIRTSHPDLEDRQELELLNLEAEIALAEGNEEEAAEILERIVDRDPMNGRALLTLGNYY
ncbi:MAG: hypothetical protein EA425_16770, partial [Puniceicoccaceae bacterium]